ncbi:MAG TPA: ABC transporter substrate-binding protein [Trebonia sp.]|jgi:iron complex transport system substrate-binding protein|nr:ABC transporter substrate-binding protein [Trebonia sp.]
MRTPQRLPAAVFVAVAATAALAGCSSASSSTPAAVSAPAPTSASAVPTSSLVPVFPTTLAATNGPVTIKTEPTRIVSLDPTATEDLYAIGAGTQVVAVDQDSNYPPGVPTTSLSGLTPNIEAIAKYSPSLVIASQNSNGLVSGLGKLGIPVLIEPAVATVADAYLQIEQVGQATGHANQALEVVKNMREEITDAVRSAGPKYQGMTYYWELSNNPYYSATSATFIGHILDMFGLKNIADAAGKPADGGYPELSQEYIVTAKPQLIFLADNQAADGGQTPAVVAKRPGWAGIPAVKNHDVFGLNDDIASRWGPRLPSLVIAIASALAGSAT